MFVENLKQDFYDVLLKNHVAVVVAREPDAACAWAALRGVLRAAGVAHSLVVVGALQQAAAALDALPAAGAALLLGLGAREDLVQALRPPEHLTLFVLDAHRPAHVCNVYSDSQVRLLYRDTEDDKIPEFDDIFEDDEDQDEDAETGQQARDAGWEQRRHQLLLQYTQYTTYATPIGVVAAELAARLGGGGGGAAGVGGGWGACVAAAGARASMRRSPAKYLLDAERALRLCGGRALLQEDAWLPLYRRWTLWGALRAALPLAPHRAVLAASGVPLAAASQPHCAGAGSWRRLLVPALRPHLPAALLAPALLRHEPLRRVQAALDHHYALLALLDHETLPAAEALALALEVLECRAEAGTPAAGAPGAPAVLRAEAGALRWLSALGDALRRYPLLKRPPFLHLHIPLEATAAAMGGNIGGDIGGDIGGWAREAAARVCWARGAAALVTMETAAGVLLAALPDHQHHDVIAAALEQAALETGVQLQRPRADPNLALLPAPAAPALLAAFTALLRYYNVAPLLQRGAATTNVTLLPASSYHNL